MICKLTNLDIYSEINFIHYTKLIKINYFLLFRDKISLCLYFNRIKNLKMNKIQL